MWLSLLLSGIVKELFWQEFANMGSLQESQANAAVSCSLIQPVDTVMGMDLSAGGHLTLWCTQLASLVRPLTLWIQR